MLSERRPAQVAVASISAGPSPGLYDDEITALMNSLSQGAGVSWRGRAWHMGRFRADGEVTFGRVGFERPGEETEAWDEELRDWRRQSQTEGRTSRFAIDFARKRVAFQVRPGLIEPYAFAGAFEALLNVSAPQGWRWDVQPAVVGIGWEEWVKSVERVTRVSFSLNPPNPHYEGTPVIKELVGDPRAERTSVAVSSADGVDTDAELVRQAVEHVREHHGGSFGARAVTATGALRRFLSKQHGQPVQTAAETDDNGEPTERALSQALDLPEAVAEEDTGE